MPLITVTVSPTGETTLETTGFAGGQCREATRALEAALGLRTAEQLTSEFHAALPQQETTLNRSSS